MAASRLTVLESREAAHAWLLVQGARRLVADSRRVRPGDAFIAWPGHATDARLHVPDAVAAGAVASLVEAEGIDAFAFTGERRVAVMRGLKAAAGDIASRFMGRPSEKLDVVAITGTNGKTSTAWWVAQALGASGRRAAVIGTLGIGEPPHRGPAAAADAGAVGAVVDAVAGFVQTGLTTPDPITLQSTLAGFADDGYAACAIEASSIGIVEHRLAGTRVAVAVFTNFTQDHLDYHGDMAAYWQAKAQLFAWPGLKAAVVNLDDAQGVELAASLAGTAIDTWTVSVRGAARLQATDVRYGRAGLSFIVREGHTSAAIATPLIGDYNVANLLAVVGVMRALGLSLADAAAACATVTPVPGRMQRVGSVDPARGQPEVVVDYAHTPDALEKALAALRTLASERGGKLWCVFGCGGNRDAVKRPLMGAIAVRLADHVVVTSDNPRLESPDFIMSQILLGAVGHDEIDVIENRAEAIRHAVGRAAANDVVLLAGKGHETYQDIAGAKFPFSDEAHALDALRNRRDKAAASASGDAGQPMLDLGTAAAGIAGARVVGDAGIVFRRVHSDTRSLRAGDLFVALRGERFDAHDFLARAAAEGAVAALAERGLADAGLAGIEVADSRLALGQLATAWRARFSLPLVVVAGSNGKTTVTQMIASILRAWQHDAAFATEGNFNNDIGVPLTLLRLRATHRAGVVELGMNHPGEIAALAAMAAPTVALVNNAQREHLEFMASVEAVARENGAAIAALGADGVAVFPADDAHAATWRAMAGARRTLTFAESASAHGGSHDGDRADDGRVDSRRPDIAGEAEAIEAGWQVVAHTPVGGVAFTLHAPGRHNVRNALAATACAIAAGCPPVAIGEGLSAFRPVRGRSQSRRFAWHGVERLLVDDTYNANPDSVRAAVDLLAAMPAPRWLVLGDMGEVGDEGPAFHREVGAYAASRGIESLWAAGAESANTVAPFAGARAFSSVQALIAALDGAPAFASLLVKGSRFMAMERVIAAIEGGRAGGAHAA